MEIMNLVIGSVILGLGFPIGKILARKTKEELHQGKKWFSILAIISAICGIASLILQKDFLLFSFLFITIITSQSIFQKNINPNSK